MSGINSSTALWYASRATGVVALLLLTAVLLLGLLVTRQGRLPGLPRFAVTGLHRNLSLIAVVFVAVHVLTAVADGYVNIPLTAAIVPLVSPYERLWLGLGAVSLDIMIAVIVTSLLRRHLGRRLWRGVHLLAYVSWPVAWLHSITSSTDIRHGALFLLALASAVLVVIAVGWRLAAAARDLPRAERVGHLMATMHRPMSAMHHRAETQHRAEMHHRAAERTTRP
ncbi:MAG: ferric reductase-like transmembrane domain-containing protein [Trebonia sp.]